MSGGSWDYMHLWEPDKAIQRHEDISRMAKRLVELGFTDAAKAMEEYAVLLMHSYMKIDARHASLGEIMRAVEWLDSSDSSVQEVAKAVSKWQGV